MLWVLIRIAWPRLLMSTHNIGFYEDLTKINFQLSSNMHLISSSANENGLGSDVLKSHKLNVSVLIKFSKKKTSVLP